MNEIYFFNQAKYKMYLIGHSKEVMQQIINGFYISASSNGRTIDFGSINVGSTPAAEARQK